MDRQFPIPGDPGYQGKDRPSDVGLPAASDAASSDDAAPDTEPLTDTEYAEHVREVRQRLDQARAEGLLTNESYTIDKRGEVWLEQREAFHDAIVNELYERAANVPADRKAIVAGGLPGAGKTTVLDGFADIDRSQFLTIDPDKIKLEMAQQDLIPSVEGLSRMEASDLVHEESSHIAKRLVRRAQADGKNLIWDITMSSRQTTVERIEALRSNGYGQIQGIFVDIPPAISETRAAERHRTGQEEYRAGKGEGGPAHPSGPDPPQR